MIATMAEACAEIEKLKARHASDYEALREFDAYGTGGDISACAREVKQQLREARAEVARGDQRLVEMFDRAKKAEAGVERLRVALVELALAVRR